MEQLSAIDKMMLASFKQSIKYNTSEFHFLLYSLNRAYEYDYISSKLKPIVSIIWVDLKDKYSAFLQYLNSKCSEVAELINCTGYTDYTSIGVFGDGYVSIDLDSLEEYIYKFPSGFNPEFIVKEFIEFYKEISILFDRCNEKIKTDINSYLL